MKLLRKVLLPFSLLYWAVTAIRNLFYDMGILKSHSFPLPVMAIGNLSTGGTGKTPQTEYLIRLLEQKYRVATLSRGYKRKSEGFVLAGEGITVSMLGDEPFQFFTKFPNVRVAVDADRKNGIEQLLAQSPKPEIILLDDAYQHRRVKAGFYILLTAYGDLYTDDFVLPAGNLREGRSGAKRANVIIVTKCLPNLSSREMETIRKKLRPQPGQEVYFTAIAYDNFAFSAEGRINVELLQAQSKVLVAGIAKPKPFFDQLKGEHDIMLDYSDHHDFTDNEISEILNKADNKPIITTEKDYMRLKGRLPGNQLYYLPIACKFLGNGDKFDKTIFDYVGTSTTNR